MTNIFEQTQHMQCSHSRHYHIQFNYYKYDYININYLMNAVTEPYKFYLQYIEPRTHYMDKLDALRPI